jgi:RIO-like serine/threonine protein kinase
MLCRVQVKELQNPDDVFDTILGLIVRLAEHGLIHCDFNEFNIMVLFSPFLSQFVSIYKF